MEETRLILNEKIPNIFLKHLGYKVISDNENVISFQKNKYDKDIYNYAMVNEIHIFRDKKRKVSEICVTPHYLRNDKYDWYNGTEAYIYLRELDKTLVKFTKIKNC